MNHERRFALTDPEIVHPFKRRPALAANHAQTILTNQGPFNRRPAFRTIKRRGHFLWWAHLSIIAASLTGCLRFETAEPAIGEAYVAPATLQLREEIAPRAPLVGTLKHGAKVEILSRHRRFARVRAAGGATGWTDGRQLLSQAGMDIVREQSERASAGPPQGSATAADSVNVHITPHRGSPTFYQLREGERVSLSGRAIMPRVPYVPPGEESSQLVTPETVRDDWSLICLPGARCGWVLTSLLMLDLPDEVIQLAEGHRITAFFTLGHTLDQEGRQRPIFLWTTSTVPPEHFQFDAFRVFAWNAARARYESTHSERGLRGYHPVVIEAGKISLVYGPAAAEGGALERHTFELRGRKLHLLTREPWGTPEQKRDLAGPIGDGPETSDSAWERAHSWLRSWWK